MAVVNNNNEGAFSLSFTPPIIRSAKVSVQGNFTIQLHCDQEKSESQTSCHRCQVSKLEKEIFFKNHIMIYTYSYIRFKIYFPKFRLTNNETTLFLGVDSKHFLFRIANQGEKVRGSFEEKSNDVLNIPFSLFDTNNHLIVYFESSVIGLYNVEFHVKYGSSDVAHKIKQET